MLTWPLAPSTKADEKKFESRVNYQQRCYIYKNLQMLTLLPPAVEVCERVQRPEDRLRGKIFHLRKSEGHQLLKTQHVSWLHYHIMDYWCDCQWGNCHLCLFHDGFLPDCRTWKTVKGPSSLISRCWKNKHPWFEEAVLHTILQPFSAHLSARIRVAVTIISKFLMLDCRQRCFFIRVDCHLHCYLSQKETSRWP